jgi:hypothetical protein
MTHLNSKDTAAATPVDYASIARIASAVELRDIALRSSRASLNVAANEIPPSWSGEAFVGFDTKLTGHEVGGRDFTIEAAFVAVYNSSWADEIHAELPEPDPENPAEIEIQASFELTYRAEEGAELALGDLESFAIANGTLHAWPYWRELADDITTRMHVPRLVVGVFKIPSRHDPGGRPESRENSGTDAEVPPDPARDREPTAGDE